MDATWWSRRESALRAVAALGALLVSSWLVGEAIQGVLARHWVRPALLTVGAVLNLGAVAWTVAPAIRDEVGRARELRRGQ